MNSKMYLGLIFAVSLAVGCTKNDQESETVNEASGPTLTEQLEAKAKESESKAPDDVKKIMKDAIKELSESEVMKSALKKGSMAPEFTLPDVKRGQVSSTDLIEKGPLVITFYRGGWCPYCNLQLRDLQKHLKEIRATGAELVAISPEVPDETAETVKKSELDFYVLSDADGKVGKQFGLMFELNDELKTLYQKFGIDLERSNGNKEWELPLGATYIVDGDGQIIYSFVDADYKKRAETKELVKILKSL